LQTQLYKTIVFTGPESCGKSTLAKAVSSKIDSTLIDEYAREYLTQKTTYCQEDLLTIAKKQQDLIDRGKHKSHLPTPPQGGNNIICCDTDLLTIKIWSDYKYGNCNSSIIDTLKNNVPDLYILCKPDFPWQEDVLRENPNDRDELYRIYLNEIKALKIPFIEVGGSVEERLKVVFEFISKGIISRKTN
jgi:nicotinamide riboside kinase